MFLGDLLRENTGRQRGQRTPGLCWVECFTFRTVWMLCRVTSDIIRFVTHTPQGKAEMTHTPQGKAALKQRIPFKDRPRGFSPPHSELTAMSFNRFKVEDK